MILIVMRMSLWKRGMREWVVHGELWLEFVRRLSGLGALLWNKSVYILVYLRVSTMDGIAWFVIVGEVTTPLVSWTTSVRIGCKWFQSF